MTRQTRNSERGPRRGVVLLSVLVVLVLLTLAAYQYSELMLAEYKAADSYRRSTQARALADSGVHYAAALLSSPDTVSNSLNGNPYDNPQVFQGILVQDHEVPRFRGRFSIVAPLDPDTADGRPSSGVVGTTQGYRFGVIDESGKLNLQALMKIDSSGQQAHRVLMALPGMTDDVANSILDWIDPNTTDPRPNGAKNLYYGTLNPPYRCKNGPLDSLEELLLVKGVTPQLLFGNDRNRNGMLDPGEDDGSGVLDRGWSAFLTIHSRELNIDSQGNPRININDRDLEGLYQKLETAVGADLAAYISAYRQYGSSSSSGDGQRPGGGASDPDASRDKSGSGGSAPESVKPPAATGKPGGSGPGAGGPPGGGSGPASRLTRNQLNFQSGRPQPIASLYDLVNSTVSIPGQRPQDPATKYPSPMSDPASIKQLLPQLLDKTTTLTDPVFPGRVNVNTAPRAVLSALPGLSSNGSMVQAILDGRPSTSSTDAPDPIFRTPAWLITEASLPVSTLKTLERYITAGTQVYRVQALGYFDGGGPAARIEAVIDANAGRPRIVYWRDLTELGKGFDLQSGP